MRTIILLLIVLDGILICQGWVNQTISPQPPILNSVHAANTSVVYACGINGTVLYTSDGGVNWLYRNPSQAAGQSIYSITTSNLQTVYCLYNTTNSGTILKSTNAGLNWSIAYSRTGIYLNDIEFVNSNTAFVYGNPLNNRWFLLRTTNNGITFDTLSARPTAGVNELGYPNAMHIYNMGNFVKIWFGTNNYRIIYSNNNGLSWLSSPVTNGQYVHGITFLDSNNGYCGGSSAFQTTNGGYTWIQQPNYPTAGTIMSFINIAGQLWYSSGSNIYTSTNNGLSFSLQFNSGNNSAYKHLSFAMLAGDRSTITGWGVTNNGTISAYSNTNGILPISNTLPERSELKQNYPNPFNPSTKIRFNIGSNAYTKLSICNELGQIISNPVNEFLHAGEYEIKWDGTEYTNGIYFYTIESGSFKESRKMILLK